MEKWVLINRSEGFMEFVDRFEITPYFAAVLKNRGIKTVAQAEKFLNGTLKDMRCPADLPDIDTAILKLFCYIKEGKKIRVIGDYDVDGICSTFILARALKLFGANSDYKIPHRVNDGYGLNVQMIEAAKEDGVSLILTCDNGISAIEAVDYANELGMEVIVTDHHEPVFADADGERKEILPRAVAVVDPKIEKSSYGFDGICGAEVAYKLIQRAVEIEKINLPEEEMRDFAVFASMATVCDVMELIDENRVLVKHGLSQLRNVKNIGLRTLLDMCLPGKDSYTAYHFGFIIGPCLNAAGRLDSAELAMNLLMSEDQMEAFTIAKRLQELNDKRKSITEEGIAEACEYIKSHNLEDKKIIVVKTNVFEAVCGIVAGRLKEMYNRPVFVFAESNGLLKGSGRSIDEYDMHGGLVKVSYLLTKFGGHKLAAGLSIEADKLEEFDRLINEECQLTKNDFVRKLIIDLELRLPGADLRLANELESMEPVGVGNRKPLFASRNVKFHQARVIGKDGKHLKFSVSEGDNKRYDLMLWGRKEEFDAFFVNKCSEEALFALYSGNGDQNLTIAYEIEKNEYMGATKVQLVLKSFV